MKRFIKAWYVSRQQVPRYTKKDIIEQKNATLILAKERLEYFNQTYQFSFTKISVRNQKTRWGSCSKKGSLNFNAKIALLPKHLADYIIVHELCHLGEFNHSQKFWSLVAQTIPNYLECRKALRQDTARFL